MILSHHHHSFAACWPIRAPNDGRVSFSPVPITHSVRLFVRSDDPTIQHKLPITIEMRVENALTSPIR